MKDAKRKKKRRSRAGDPVSRAGVPKARAENPVARDGVDEEGRSLSLLTEAFSSVSIDRAKSVLIEADGDVNKAADLVSVNSIDGFSSGSVSGSISGSEGSLEGSGFANGFMNRNGIKWGWGSSSGSGSGSEGSFEGGCVDGLAGKRNKQNKVVAVAGSVSSVLGKDYVKRVPKRESVKDKEIDFGDVNKADAEQFLCSMLGDDCELNMGVVRDVLCQCGYDVEKAMNALLDLSASSVKQSRDDRFLLNGIGNKTDARFLLGNGDNLTDQASECTSHTSENEMLESIWSLDYDCRSNLKPFSGSKESQAQHNIRSAKSDLSQKVLESLFNVPKSSEREPASMNWKTVAKKLESLGNGFIYPSSAIGSQHQTYAKGEEYHILRKDAQHQWDTTRSYYQRAAEAYSKGERQHATYLSEQGKLQTKRAREADERASHDIFKARNRDIENVITIDLHGQHVKQAMKLLKVHLLFGAYVPSIQTLRVITGCGAHGVGKSKLKQSVTDLLEREGVRWREENQGTVLIKLDGYRDYSFIDTDCDVD